MKQTLNVELISSELNVGRWALDVSDFVHA